MKKAFDQTVRDIKREVNKKVLKVPGIEQKVLDATSNEPWGPHGTLLADIAQATRNYHEYQMIMSIIWKRISDIGKNWRHVYKGLTVLEYLVANGSERVIDDIREHAYQISALADFQYIDSGARDQGNNVRRKSQSLVALVNDKDRIVEVRQKAAANREKFRASSTSGMYRPGSYEGRYGSRDDDRNGYGREREWGSRDEDRSGRNGDSYGRDGDRYGRDYEDRYGRDGYKDDDYRGSNRGTGEYQYGSRSRSSERDRDRAYDDDGEYSSRGSGARVDGQSQNERVHEQKLSEQSTGAPPSYEEAVTESQSPVHSERDGEPASSSAARASPQISSSSTIEATSSNYDAAPVKQGVDEFDPRGSAVAPVSAPPATSSNVGMDLLGPLTDVYSLNVLAIMPAPSSETDAHGNFGSEPTYGATASASDVPNQAFEHPFGDAPFKAVPSANGGDTSSATTYPASNAPGAQPPTSSQLSAPESSSPQQGIDILADILPPSGPQPLAPSQSPLSSSTGHPAQPIANYYGGFQSQAGSAAPVVPYTASHTQYQTGPAAQFSGGNLHQYQGPTASSHSALQTMSGPAVQSDMLTQTGPHPSSTGSFSIVAQPSKQKFETKSTVWADTLSRGLVDLNISGSKTNPMADIGIDFAALNRKEKRMEKPSAATPVTSTISMGRAMGSGSGMGRAGATSLRPASNPMMGPGMAMGGGYRPMSQPMGMVMNSGMGMNNMRMGQGVPMQPPTGMPPGYNPMMGTGGYASQQPYGGYR